jgi:hypothetical protein
MMANDVHMDNIVLLLTMGLQLGEGKKNDDEMLAQTLSLH